MTGAAQEKGSQVRWCRAWLEPVPPGWPTCRSTAMRGCGRSFNRMMGADVHTHQSVQGQSRPGRRLPAPRQAHTSSSWSGPRLPGPWQARAAHAKACEHAVAQAGEVLTSLKTYEPAVAQAGEGLAAIHAFVAVEHYTGGQVCRPGGGHAASCPAALLPAHTAHCLAPTFPPAGNRGPWRDGAGPGAGRVRGPPAPLPLTRHALQVCPMPLSSRRPFPLLPTLSCRRARPPSWATGRVSRVPARCRGCLMTAPPAACQRCLPPALPCGRDGWRVCGGARRVHPAAP